MSSSKINIEFVNTDEELVSLANKLKNLTEFAFDTEFDRFWREYGFKLLLIQIYDGEICYLIDPLAIKNLQPLWLAFENLNICKIAYASSEDIQLLKINGCATKNIFDVQIAAKLCNHPGNSFGDLVLDLCNNTIDKSLQRSNWRTRPLPMEQQIYASNDVIWLPQLKKHFYELLSGNNLLRIMQTENLACENIPVTPYEVKLTAKQHARYVNHFKDILMQMLVLRDEIAKANNLPPFMICSDSTLENIIENSASFLQNPFEKGFSSKLKNNEKYNAAFFNIVKAINTTIYPLVVKKVKPINLEYKATKTINKDEVENNWGKIHQNVTNKYGTISGEFIIRGLKKALLSRPYNEINLKQYQRNIIDEVCADLNIVL
jgi:ribonuclease D